MKKTIYRYIITTIIFLLSVNLLAQNTHIGLWKGIDDKGELGYLNLDEKGYTFLIIKGDTIGGEKFSQNGIEAKMKYEIDYSTSPKKIDFIVTRTDNGQELGRLLGIIDFIGDDEMKIRFSFTKSERPKDFLPPDNDDTVILKKVK